MSGSQGIVPPRFASQLPRTTGKWDGRNRKGGENVYGVAELLPRCERLMLASRRIIKSVSSSLPSRTLGQMSPRGNNSVPYYLVSVTLPLRLRILS